MSNICYWHDLSWYKTGAYDGNYTYDNAGNFITLKRYSSTGSIQDSLNYTYGTGSNRVFNIRGSASANYTYDANGNVRYDSHRGIGYIIYDPSNMPIQAYLTNGQQLVYDNDVNGSRVRNTIQGSNGSDNFYFNGADGKTEAVSLVAHGSNLIYNILGAGGDNLGQVKVVSASPTRYYYLKDHLGSIKMTIDTTGTVVGYDDYYPYGLVMTGRSLTASEDGRYKFTGKERDASTGLDYFGARYYDSWSGRWDQVDPWIDKYPGYSPYNYTLNNPLRLIDLKGKGPFDLSAISTAISNAISNFKEELANYTKEIMGADQESYKNTTIETEAQTNQERVENNGLSNQERAQVYSGAFTSFVTLMAKTELFALSTDVSIVGGLAEGTTAALTFGTANVAISGANDLFSGYLNGNTDFLGTKLSALTSAPPLISSSSIIGKSSAAVGIFSAYMTFDLESEKHTFGFIFNFGNK